MSVSVSQASLVQYAAQGDVTVVDLLLQAGLSPNDPEPMRGVTALHNAAAQGHFKLVQRLIGLAVDINPQDTNGMTPLINAVYAGHLEVANLLLQHRADPGIVPKASPTALNLVVQRNNMAMFELLLKSDASQTLADAFGSTPLSIAKALQRTAMVARLEAVHK
jgi:uncharacterized protein